MRARVQATSRSGYTECVGARKLATVLLIVLIAGGPAVVAMCEAVCLPSSPTEASTREALRDTGEHHQHHRDAEAPSDAEQVRAGDHNHQPVSEIGTAGDGNVVIGRALARACCEQLAPPNVSLSASRADGDLLPGSQAALLAAAPMVTVRDRQPAGPTHGPPPGEPLPVRTSVVLRI